MPNFDNRKAAAVWQRVHAAPERQPGDASAALALIPQLSQCAALTQHDRQLSAAFSRQAACLAGIYRLLTGNAPGKLPPQKSSGLSYAALQKCYAIQLQALQSYETLSQNRELAPAIAELTRLGQSTCATLLSLMGQSQKP